ncbi:MAG TPA: peroxiredoxin [Myxococcales bacterium]|jgi:osmotically inducible protein OsmC|nr:peroxiredoxin [Myxococcales bacterium]
MPTRTGEAIWRGSFKRGSGTVAVATGLLKADYSASSRFENGAGTNPEELLGAAHAGCFSMALALGLGEAGFVPNSIHTTARVSIERVGGGFRITRIVLSTEAEIPGIDESTFLQHAEAAKKGCPVSQALAATPIELEARLLQSQIGASPQP